MINISIEILTHTCPLIVSGEAGHVRVEEGHEYGDHDHQLLPEAHHARVRRDRDGVEPLHEAPAPRRQPLHKQKTRISFRKH